MKAPKNLVGANGKAVGGEIVLKGSNGGKLEEFGVLNDGITTSCYGKTHHALLSNIS
jgi:hypothetical protein